MVHNSALVDVLVCTRDGDRELPTLLSSLALQDFQEFQIIIRDESQNGSVFQNRLVSKTIDLLTRKNISLIYCRDWESKGIAHARHCILRLASKRHVWFVDDDVIVEPQCLQRLLETIGVRECGYVQGAKVSVDNSYGFETFSPKQLKTADRDEPCIFAQYKTDIIQPISIGDTANILFDRDKLLSVGGFSFFEEIGTDLIGEDWIAAALVADRFGGVLRTGALAWHLGRDKKARPFRAERQFVLRFLQGKVSTATLQAVEAAWF